MNKNSGLEAKIKELGNSHLEAKIEELRNKEKSNFTQMQALYQQYTDAKFSTAKAFSAVRLAQERVERAQELMLDTSNEMAEKEFNFAKESYEAAYEEYLDLKAERDLFCSLYEDIQKVHSESKHRLKAMLKKRYKHRNK